MTPLGLISALESPFLAAFFGAYLGAVAVAVSVWWDKDKLSDSYRRDLMGGTVFMTGPVIAAVVALAVSALAGEF